MSTYIGPVVPAARIDRRAKETGGRSAAWLEGAYAFQIYVDGTVTNSTYYSGYDFANEARSRALHDRPDDPIGLDEQGWTRIVEAHTTVA